jgi:type IV pilus assembly protein PilX
MNMATTFERHRTREAGATLIIALIMLLVLTVLGTTTARMTLMEERMTGNTQDFGIAFQAAEGALRQAEEFLRQPVLPAFNNANGLFQPAAPAVDPVWKTVAWTNPAQVITYDELAGAPGSLPQAAATFIIEELPRVPTPGETLSADTPVEDANFYRVTARGVGTGGNATVTLQTTFKR